MNNKLELRILNLEKLLNNDAQIMPHQLHTLLEMIYELFSLIKKRDTKEEAAEYFFLLGKIQHYLARLTFVYNINLPQELMKIVRDCERIDDNDVRDFLFHEIKHDRYNLKSDAFLWYK